MPSSAPFVVGIDLGTTNCALAYVDTRLGDPATVQHFAILQVVNPGEVEERPLLPSFLYLPGPGEQPPGTMRLPWEKNPDFAVGDWARTFGNLVPTRLVSSAKSWLCHSGVDRRQPLLPWKAPPKGRQVSPVEASSFYLKHLAQAWNYHWAKGNPQLKLENQEIVLTVPASFDAAARDLTVEAARLAGFENMTLLEEPQAAFYAWIDQHQKRWRDEVEVGDVILIVDVGGGTTDFTLIGVTEEAGQLILTRLAVGDHILLGGDNMDLAMAHHVARGLVEKGIKLDTGQRQMLWHSCRMAKENLFSNPKLSQAPVTILGRGSKVVGGTIKTELSRTDLEKILVDGFFPKCSPQDQPQVQKAVGLQELGLLYTSDPAVSRHLAYFLRQNEEVVANHLGTKKKKKGSTQCRPRGVLFNGGVFKAEPLRDRLLAILKDWVGKESLQELPGGDLDKAVAMGAAYYGMVRRGKGVRIRGGTARSYYMGIESSMPAVPGSRPAIKALCVAPFGMEEGTELDVPGQEFGLVVGEIVEFRFLGSTLRRQDQVGFLLDDWQSELDELSPLEIMLSASGKQGRTVPVHLHTKVTEIGTLELWCISRDGKERWKLEFNVRNQGEIG